MTQAGSLHRGRRYPSSVMRGVGVEVQNVQWPALTAMRSEHRAARVLACCRLWLHEVTVG
ncbi:hypothetical protein EYF80_030318 [Liparis tanakae]|uniref:Uncharacterized protein n=1 Tax=Liparis tanakae TaxID=230148 RepID=A0A4Z2H337_9TELE|nr:hypothetical protein EYF80_030318 [Liparis tanakae]